MKYKETYEFRFALGCRCSEIKELVEIEFETGMTIIEKQESINKTFKDWIVENSSLYEITKIK